MRSTRRTPLGPTTAPTGTYKALYQGRSITVTGPQRTYPSGLAYYRTDDLDGTLYVFAGHLDSITRAPRNPLQWLTGLLPPARRTA